MVKVWRNLALAFLLGVLSLTPAFSLELTKGRLKVVLHEEIGRYSLYYLSDLKEKTYLALFLDEDPRTSVMNVLVDNKIYRIGDHYDFKGRAELFSNGIRFIWESKTLQISQEFIPIVSNTKPLEDGVKITLSVENISEQDLVVGVRLLFDTYLGEDKNLHFKTDTISKIERELTIAKDNMAQYWLSPVPDKQEELGLQCITAGEGITSPDKIVFANWKRLDDSSWDYETSSSRNFTRPPYSFNDSAVVHYYDPQNIPQGTVRKIVMVMGNYNASGYDISGKKTTGDINTLLQQAETVTSEISDLYYSVQADLSTLNKVLDTINSQLSTQEGISEEDLEVIEQILSGLKERSKEYSETQ